MTAYRIAVNRQTFASAVIDVNAESPEQAEQLAAVLLKNRNLFGVFEWDESDTHICIDAVYPVNAGGER